MISIILPTYNEAENIKLIVCELSEMLDNEDIDGEIIVVDDNSPDGTADIANGLAAKYPVRVHVRTNERGLSRSVIKGIELAEGDVCVVMDADLSHPVEKVPAMIKPILDNRCDATVGSRNIVGGGCEAWPVARRMISKVAGLLAKGVTTLSDPTSGFMAIRKSILNDIKLDPLGWKIVLEAIVKTNPRILEVPILFADRQEGKSKLGFRAQVDYIHHLWRLYCYKYPGISQFLKFCMVGVSGLMVDTAVLISFVSFFSFDPRFAAIFAFIAAVSWNYVFNRSWAFEVGRNTKISHSYVSFVTICTVGLGIRICVMHLLIEYANMGENSWYILSSFFGIAAATIFNFLGSKYIAFSRFFSRN